MLGVFYFVVSKNLVKIIIIPITLKSGHQKNILQCHILTTMKGMASQSTGIFKL